jgi:hypothetical protein
VTGSTKAQEANYSKIARRILVVDASFNLFTQQATTMSEEL